MGVSDSFDLDAAIEEAHGTSKQVKFAGKMWDFPATIPLSILRRAQNDVDGALDDLLGPENSAELIEAGFSIQAMEIVLRDLYDLRLGEAGASPQPLNRAGRRARQTSSGTTGSTSAKPSRRSA